MTLYQTIDYIMGFKVLTNKFYATNSHVIYIGKYGNIRRKRKYTGEHGLNGTVYYTYHILVI